MIVFWNEINQWLHQFLGKSFKVVMWTLVSMLLLSVIYGFLALYVKNQNKSERKKYYSLNTIRNSFIIIFILVELFLWSGELKTLVLSAAAIFAATMVTFKEVIMCLVGSFLIRSNKLFTMGEYIEYDHIKGKIIDKNLLYTKILIGENFQTKELNIPNAVFITNKIINLSKFGKYQMYELSLAIEKMKDVAYYKKFIEDILADKINKDKEEYIKYFNEKKSYDIFFEMPTTYYEINILIHKADEITMNISFLSLTSKHKQIEQEIMNSYIEEVANRTTDIKDIDI